jgi:hypothetical protein
VHLAFGLKPVTRASARDVSLRLGGALSWRSAVLALLGTTASRAGGKPVAHRELDLAAVKPMSLSIRSSSRWSWRMALRRRCSAAARRTNRALRRANQRSQFKAARMQPSMKRLRSIAARRSSSKDESGRVAKNDGVK